MPSLPPPSLPPTTLAEPNRDEEWYETDDERESGVRARPSAPAAAIETDVTAQTARSTDAEPTDNAKLEELESELLGTELGAYRVIERIGSGAMGHVFRAEHQLLGRSVAIKMLRPELVQDEACVNRFLAEARAVNLIGHANIIDVTDFARTESGQPWFVMELLEGSDLAAALLREPMAVTRALEIARQLCDALAAVHTAGIVHRDVKPENTFLTQNEGKDFVKLLDFGIARLPDPTSPDPLQEGLVGTPQYMAPEQVSASAIDHRADLYAFGSLLYELLTGRTPFRANEMQELLAQVLLDVPVAPSELAELPVEVRAELDELVLRCLAKKPADRPSSAREIGEMLEAIQAKLEAPQVTEVEAVEAQPAAAAVEAPLALELHASDAHPESIDAARVRKRARQVRHAQRVWSSRSATLLAAAAAAAAMWIATSERSWAHAAFWRMTDSTVDAQAAGVHVVRPVFTASEAASVPAAVAVVAEQPEPQPVLTAAAPVLPEGTIAPAATLEREEPQRDTRRSQRAKARAERRAAEKVRPELVIKPIDEPSAPLPEKADAPVAPPAPPVLDRDLVLNPFAK